MSEDTTTTTEQETVKAEETLQPEQPETQAVQVEETKTEETQAEETQEEETTDTTDQTNEVDEAKEAEKDLLEWAEKKGLKLDDPIALAKMVREGDKKVSQYSSEAKALKDSVNTVGEEQGLDDTSQMLNRLQVTEFYLNNPDAKALDEEMGKIVNDKPNLSGDLDLVYEIAKSRTQATKSIEERQVGRKEALAQVAKAEQAASSQASATTREGTHETTDADIANMTVTEYQAYKKDTGFNPFRQS